MSDHKNTPQDTTTMSFENTTKFAHRTEDQSTPLATKGFQNQWLLIGLVAVALIGVSAFGNNTPVKINNYNVGDGAKIQAK